MLVRLFPKQPLAYLNKLTKNNKDLRNLILDVARFLNNKDKGDGNPLEDLMALLNGEELDDNAIMRILGNGGNIVN